MAPGRQESDHFCNMGYLSEEMRRIYEKCHDLSDLHTGTDLLKTHALDGLHFSVGNSDGESVLEGFVMDGELQVNWDCTVDREVEEGVTADPSSGFVFMDTLGFSLDDLNHVIQVRDVIE